MDINKLVNSEEAVVYNYYFDMCDIDRCARLFPDVVAFCLRRSMISDEILAKIWNAIDPTDIGWLDRKRFYIGLKLTAAYQQEKVFYTDFKQLATNISQPPDLGPLPSIDLPSIDCPLVRLIEAEQEFIARSRKQPDGKWLIVPNSASEPSGNRYAFCSAFLALETPLEDIFAGLDHQLQGQFKGLAVLGKLSCEQCQQIMSSSGLSSDILAKIWASCGLESASVLDEVLFIHLMRMVYLADRTSALFSSSDVFAQWGLSATTSTNDKLRQRVQQLDSENELIESSQVSRFKTRVVEKRSELARLESEIDLALRKTKELNATRCECETHLERSKTRMTDLRKQVDELERMLKSTIESTDGKKAELEHLERTAFSQQARRNSIPDQLQAMKAKEDVITKRVSSTRDHLNQINVQIEEYRMANEKLNRTHSALEQCNGGLKEVERIIQSGGSDLALAESILSKVLADKLQILHCYEEPRTAQSRPVSHADRRLKVDAERARSKSSVDFTLAEFDPF